MAYIQLHKNHTVIQRQLPKGSLKIVYSLLGLLCYFVFPKYYFLFFPFCMSTLLKINILLCGAGKPDGVVFRIQGNSLNRLQSKCIETSGALWFLRKVGICYVLAPAVRPEIRVERGSESEGQNWARETRSTAEVTAARNTELLEISQEHPAFKFVIFLVATIYV